MWGKKDEKGKEDKGGGAVLMGALGSDSFPSLS